MAAFIWNYIFWDALQPGQYMNYSWPTTNLSHLFGTWTVTAFPLGGDPGTQALWVSDVSVVKFNPVGDFGADPEKWTITATIVNVGAQKVDGSMVYVSRVVP